MSDMMLNFSISLLFQSSELKWIKDFQSHNKFRDFLDGL